MSQLILQIPNLQLVLQSTAEVLAQIEALSPTEAVRALIEFATSTPAVRGVCAHTLSDNTASARVLAKSGFQYVGEVIDPEDGLVCRWELVRDSEV